MKALKTYVEGQYFGLGIQIVSLFLYIGNGIQTMGTKKWMTHKIRIQY